MNLAENRSERSHAHGRRHGDTSASWCGLWKRSERLSTPSSAIFQFHWFLLPRSPVSNPMFTK